MQLHLMFCFEGFIFYLNKSPCLPSSLYSSTGQRAFIKPVHLPRNYTVSVISNIFNMLYSKIPLEINYPFYQAGIRYRLTQKHYLTHGSAATDELGKLTERWVTDKGDMYLFRQLEAWSRDVESGVSEVTKLVGRQRLGENVGSSTFAKEDSFYRRNKYLYTKAEVSTLNIPFYCNINFCAPSAAWKQPLAEM